MLNTFENYRRHTLRRNELEQHLRRIEALSIYREDESALCSIVDNISGMPLRKNESVIPRFKSRKLAFVSLLGLTLSVAAFVLGLSLGSRGFSSRDDKSDKAGALKVQYDDIIALILGWDVTSLERLQDGDSAPARAVQWILAGDTNVTNPEILQERYALAVIYFETQASIDEGSWTTDENWLSSHSVCFWYGVDCSSKEMRSGGVRSLNLSSNGLTGSLPAEIALLNLESLGLYSNSLFGSIPRTLGRMTDLGK
jgi:hypothetical protein